MDMQGFITKYATPQNLIIVALIIVIIVIIYRSRAAKLEHDRSHRRARKSTSASTTTGTADTSYDPETAGDDLLSSLVDSGTVTTPTTSSE